MSLNHIKKQSTKLILVSCVVSLSITGCEQASELFDIFERKPDSSTETYKVKVPETAPLEAGSSVSDSLTMHNQKAINGGNEVTLDPTDQSINKAKPATIKTSKTDNNKDKKPSIVTGKFTPGTPQMTVYKALNALYYSTVKQTLQYYDVKNGNLKKTLVDLQPLFQKNTEFIRIETTDYSSDKSTAVVDVVFKTKSAKNEKTLPYHLKKVNGKWLIVVE